jgi:hypothetical protein
LIVHTAYLSQRDMPHDKAEREREREREKFDRMPIVYVTHQTLIVERNIWCPDQVSYSQFYAVTRDHHVFSQLKKKQIPVLQPFMMPKPCSRKLQFLLWSSLFGQMVQRLRIMHRTPITLAVIAARTVGLVSPAGTVWDDVSDGEEGEIDEEIVAGRQGLFLAAHGRCVARCGCLRRRPCLWFLLLPVISYSCDCAGLAPARHAVGVHLCWGRVHVVVPCAAHVLQCLLVERVS